MEGWTTRKQSYTHVLINFNKKDGVDRKEYQADVGPDPDEEVMEDVRLDEKIKRQWRMIFEGNDGGLDNQEAIIHSKRWDVYMNEKNALIRGGYSVEVSGYDGNKVI